MPKSRYSSASHLVVKKDTAKPGKIFSHIRQRWFDETPEELVRQTYLCVLVNEYGFELAQMDEEISVTGRGSAQARADFIIWRSAKDKADKNSPLIIVECKSDNITIKAEDYEQGDHYARLSNAKFFVTHNSRETRYWRALHEKMPKSLEEVANIPGADVTDKEIEELLAKLLVFKEDEFADLLHQCHNVIRNRDKLDPAAAFDEIAKILFVKVYVEREMRRKQQKKNLFTVEVMEEQFGDDPLNDLFARLRDSYRDDKLFAADERIELKIATAKEIVRLLQKYNLSETIEDVKGIAFERFLGRTFRGEIGQFFTPREIVRFMIEMTDPKEGDIVCDPASGSGGFLVRFFARVREQIYASADAEYRDYRRKIASTSSLSAPKKAAALREKYEQTQRDLDQRVGNSRMWQLSNNHIYGCDANDRMARTSKMNMIMHGDGHGGVHHWDGFYNINGIFENRFDLILTNPPFGANVEPSDHVMLPDDSEWKDLKKKYAQIYGDPYREAVARTEAAVGKPIASLFELPKRGSGEDDKPKRLGKTKTEILFIERCLSLLKPGGRLGIVLPEGIFNNPSLAFVREFVENRAFLRAVISLPQDTFVSSGASVKCSLLFLEKFTEKEQKRFDQTEAKARKEIEDKYAPEMAATRKRIADQINHIKTGKTATHQAASSIKKETVGRSCASSQTLLQRPKSAKAAATSSGSAPPSPSLDGVPAQQHPA